MRASFTTGTCWEGSATHLGMQSGLCQAKRRPLRAECAAGECSALLQDTWTRQQAHHVRVLLSAAQYDCLLRRQVSQRLHAQCQAFLLSQLPEEARPPARAAAGHLDGVDFDNPPSDQLGRIPAEAHEGGGGDAMHAPTNGPCTIAEQGVRALHTFAVSPPCFAQCLFRNRETANIIIFRCMCSCAATSAAAGELARPAGSWGIPPFFVERGPHTDAHQRPAFDFRCSPALGPLLIWCCFRPCAGLLLTRCR